MHIASFMIRCIIYDVGHTLMSPVPAEEALRHFSAHVRELGVPVERVLAALPDARAHMRLRDQPIGSLWTSDARLHEAWRGYYATALRDAGLDVPWDDLLALGGEIDDLYRHPDRWDVYPDVPGVLVEARERGLRQGVISDWETALPGLLHGLDLEFHFDFIVASAAIGFAKPSREIFDHALARAGLPAAQCLYVGDSYVLDVLGARSAGLHAALIDREGVAPKLDCPVLRSLAGIFDLVDAIPTRP